MSSKPLYTKLARALDSKIPVTLEKNLIASSFDSEASILGINSEIIKELELFVSQNKNILENTEYSHVLNNNSTFKFKPGHKSVLNLLPKCLRDYNLKNSGKKQQNKQSANAERDEEQLKELLIKKLLNFCTKHSFVITFETSLIQNYHIDGKKQPKCKINCPICGTQFTCYYTTYWNESNFEKHLKKHFNSIEIIEVTEVQSNESNESEPNQKKI